MREQDSNNIIPTNSPKVQIITNCIKDSGSNKAVLMSVN